MDMKQQLAQSVLHMMNQEFCYALEEDYIKIKLRVGKSLCSKVRLAFVDKYKYLHQRATIEEMDMELVAQDEAFDYYEGIIENQKRLVINYYFILETKQGEFYYGADRLMEQAPFDIRFMYFLSGNVLRSQRFSPISWATEGIVYQIFPDRFDCGEGGTQKGDWSRKPSPMDHFGGNINGITKHLDYLQELGVTILYLTPIFESTSNHKYNTKDYMKLDPSFGTMEDVKNFVQQAHEKGMKVIFDGVFNHSGDDFAPFCDVVKKGEASEYKDWFQIHSFPLETDWRKEPNYGSFSYFAGMPQLNPDSKELRDYVKQVIDYWMQETDIDGWRLDVADEVTHGFWKEFRKWVKANKKDAIIIGEVWYDSREWLKGDEFDTVMNYDFYYAVKDFLVLKEIDAKEFINQLERLRGMYHKSAYEMLWNLIDSHDCARFLTDVGENKNILKQAVLLQMTMTGTPMIYYGDEVGMIGGTDPDCRRGMVWEDEKQDKELLEFYKKIIQIRKAHPSLVKGELLSKTEEKSNVLIFEKKWKEEKMLVVINASKESYTNSEITGKVDMLTGKRIEQVEANGMCLIQKS